jgi:hypothetical protein
VVNIWTPIPVNIWTPIDNADVAGVFVACLCALTLALDGLDHLDHELQPLDHELQPLPLATEFGHEARRDRTTIAGVHYL